jgi:hypothetical protein
MTGKVAYPHIPDTLADWQARGPDRRAQIPGGLEVTSDSTVESITPGGAASLILPGSETWPAPEHDPVPVKAADFLAAGVPAGAICGDARRAPAHE